MKNNENFEDRLSAMREQAKHGAPLRGRGVDVVGGPIPRRAGYYGQSVVRPPVWSWEVPLYFFVGGAAGMAPLIACSALVLGLIDLAYVALWIAGMGAIISPILLVADLGRPRLFINMLRVFKYQSPMSVGAWIVTFFSGFAFPAWLLMLLHVSGVFPGSNNVILIIIGLFSAGAALFGLGLATYTGVLIGATAIPAWHLHHILLPIHFGTAGLGCASAILELAGFQIGPLWVIGMVVACVETLLWIWLEFDRHGAADRALHERRSGWLVRAGEFFSGPLPIIFRIVGLVPFAAASFLLGALISRFGWISAGGFSGADPEAVFASQSGR